MGLQWQRTVAVMGSGTSRYLQVTLPAGGNPDGRHDGAEDITVYQRDRGNGGAQVRYVLTGTGGLGGELGVDNKAGGDLPSGFSSSVAGNTLTITDGEGASNGVDFSYYVTYSTSQGVIRTADPMIHNAEDPPLR